MNKMKKIAGLGVSLVMLSAVGLSDVYAAASTTPETLHVASTWCDGKATANKGYLFHIYYVKDLKYCKPGFWQYSQKGTNAFLPNTDEAACKADVPTFNKDMESLSVPNGEYVCVETDYKSSPSVAESYQYTISKYKSPIGAKITIKNEPLGYYHNQSKGNWIQNDNP